MSSSSHHEHTSPYPTSSRPVHASYASEKITTGAGVAIFHLASARVVVCYHSRDGYWFLPKGRRNVGEETGAAAEREGFEESGYRNRLLPLPILHRQPEPDDALEPTPFVTEPLWTQLLPQSKTAQYLLFWYAAETLPPEAEEEADVAAAAAARSRATDVPELEKLDLGAGSDSGGAAAAAATLAATANPNPSVEATPTQPGLYTPPPPYPPTLRIADRISMDSLPGGAIYEPVRHEGTGVDEEEALYEAYLLPIQEARRKLRGTVMADVVRRGWEGVGLRRRMEEEGG
ncbi:hypothetical protein M8818_003694 [Zalaria obscura]|uniref:Uncharacterized protein n=1 Tax=Zalaria obscura TaxID=2024903 RepID=A0ACC3SE20_9PEZI